ncbi:hypothetical protein ACAW74_17175 [Fibrella sp. WM1]|uniref:hypothetical protein n=1 Tax=Fibrella musci TaxID=3242485 RepID=UPI0035219DB8
MDSLAKFVSVEKDAFYLIAQEQEQTKFVRNLLTQTSHSPEQIASLAGVSLDFVKAIQHRLATDR